MSELTIRDRATLQAIWDGHSRKAMADHFSITLSAVDRRHKRLMAKTNTQNVVQLVRKGLREGLLTL